MICLIPSSTNRAHRTARKYISVVRVRLTILSRENRYSWSHTTSSVTASKSVTTPLGYSNYDTTVTNPSRTQRRESSCEYRSTHISRSAYDTSFIGSQFRSVIEIRLFTQNCLVVIDPAYLQKLRVGVFLNTARRSLRAASLDGASPMCQEDRRECHVTRGLTTHGNAEHFKRRSKGQKQITGKQNNSRRNENMHKVINSRMQIECRSKRTTSPST